MVDDVTGCVPPEGTLTGSYHYLRLKGGDDVIAQWFCGCMHEFGEWSWVGSEIPETPQELEDDGYTYIGPVPMPSKDGIVYTINESDVLETVNWTALNADGDRRFPDMPDTTEQIDTDQAVALLLINEVIVVKAGGTWENFAYFYISIYGGFQPAWADREPLNLLDIKNFYKMWKGNPQYGAALWCMIKRRELAQKHVLDCIVESQLVDMDAFTTEHELRPNHHEAIIRITLDAYYNAYKDWATNQHLEVIPADGDWWKLGWLLYVEAHGAQTDEVWRTELDQKIKQFKEEHGYT